MKQELKTKKFGKKVMKYEKKKNDMMKKYDERQRKTEKSKIEF